jgi:hypothetical protein
MNDWQKRLETFRAALGVVDGVRRGLRELDRTGVLARLGMEARRSAPERVAPWLGGFGAGLLVGGAAGLLFAPMEGRELRAKLVAAMGRLGEDWLGYGHTADDRPGGFAAAEKGAAAGT